MSSFSIFSPSLSGIVQLQGPFFTPVSELGLALHEMWEISNLSMGSMPYEEYFPCAIELEQMEKDDQEMFKTYQELMCHFYICMDDHNARGNANGIKVWAYYLFPNLDDALEEVQFSISDADINQKMISSGHEDVILDEDDSVYEKGDKIKSFHYQAKHHISRKTLLVGFLSVWLKKCIVPSPPHDGSLSWVIVLAVQLAHSKFLGLFPVMICCILRGLQALMGAFCRPSATKSGKGKVLPRDGPCLRVEMPYTYLKAWFALHSFTII